VGNAVRKGSRPSRPIFSNFLPQNLSPTSFWLLVLMGMGGWLRFHELTFQSYWIDELFSASFSHPDRTLGEAVAVTLEDVHPPLFQTLLWFAYKVFGYSEYTGRALSATFGIATIPALYLLGREAFNRDVGRYCATLGAFSVFLIFYAQEARSYTLLFLLCTLSYAALFSVVREPSGRNIALYCGATIAMLYTHYFGFVAAASQALALPLCLAAMVSATRKGFLIRAAAVAGIIGLAVSPLLPWIFSHSDIQAFWIKQPGPGFIGLYFLLYFPPPSFAPWMLALLLFGLVRGLFSSHISAPERRGSELTFRFGTAMACFWITSCLALPYARGLFAAPMLTFRNGIITIPAMLLLAALGVYFMKRRTLRGIVLALLVGMSLYALFVSPGLYQRVMKSQFREVAAIVARNPWRYPVYHVKEKARFFNFYFEQLESGIRSEGPDVLEERLRKGETGAAFWLLDAHRIRPGFPLAERLQLARAVRHLRNDAGALLVIDPEAAQTLTPMKAPDGSSGGRASVRARSSFDRPLLIVPALEPAEVRAESSRIIRVFGAGDELLLEHEVKGFALSFAGQHTLEIEAASEIRVEVELEELPTSADSIESRPVFLVPRPPLSQTQ